LHKTCSMQHITCNIVPRQNKYCHSRDLSREALAKWENGNSRNYERQDVGCGMWDVGRVVRKSLTHPTLSYPREGKKAEGGDKLGRDVRDRTLSTLLIVA